MHKENFQKISDWLWEVPKTFRGDMNAPARVYASERMLEYVLRDKSTNQLINVAALPGITKYSLSMPDMHEGYGFPIGGVAAMDMENGVISPGGVGYDINCGMRLLKSQLSESEIRPNLEKLADRIQEEVPSGLGRGRKTKFSLKEIDKILKEGSEILIKQGFGGSEDLINCESQGKMEEADPSCVSDQAKNRGRDQVGTLGSGNHFLEIQKVEEIFDEKTASAFGLFKEQAVIMIHTGSRGLGHQIATDYIKIMMGAMGKYGIRLPDRELAACPINSQEGKRYFSAMACGANYAWANRQTITFYVRKAWENIMGESDKLTPLYDVAHNIAKKEKHEVDGRVLDLMVHRKGATRAFPPGHLEVPEKYREVGQPVLIPGSMGTASYVLAGAPTGRDSWHSTCHGAGRTMSRNEAMRKISGQEVVKSLESKGIIVKSRSQRGIAEEAPFAYKDIDSVVEVVYMAGLSNKVARLKPLAVIKGE